MTSRRPLVVVTHDPRPDARAAIEDVLSPVADLFYFRNQSDTEKDAAARAAAAVLTYHPVRDLGAHRIDLLGNCRLIQCLTAGIDFLPLSGMPAHLAVAYNAGAFAEPMAEHVVAMMMSAAKRLSTEHRLMREGEFNQFDVTKAIAGSTCAILGFGETGREVGRLMRALGVRVLAVNRSGQTDEPVAFVGTLDDLDRVLAEADTVVVTLSLTKRTIGLIGRPELARMKPDAVLVNVARGEILDEDGLYDHLRANPRFTACLDAWWIEPVRHGRFETRWPFLDLENVIASPHNSAMTAGALAGSARRGAINVRRLLDGEKPRYVAGDDERLH